MVYSLFTTIYLLSNNNNRNRVELIQNTIASDGSYTTSTEENELLTTQRVRSLFPTTEESRRRRYRSQCDLNGYTDGAPSEASTDPLIDGATLTGDLLSQKLETIELIEVDHAVADVTTARSVTQIEEKTASGPSNQDKLSEIQLNNIIEAENTIPKGPSKAEVENEFNNINPASQTDAERYEERIVQLQSAPLPCIDAVTGLVHIVGTTLSPYTDLSHFLVITMITSRRDQILFSDCSLHV